MAITLTRDLYRKAVAEGKTLSRVLEEMFDEAGMEREGSLDAYETLLKQEGIVTKSIYEKGIPASGVDAFYRTDSSQLLFPEYVSRTLRSAFSSYTPLQSLIGQYTLTDSDQVKTYYLDQPDAAKTRKKRITEAAELPKTKITSREQSVRFYKYGRALEASYEVIRRMKVDMLSRHIQFIGLQAAKDKVEEIINVLVNGDGNNNAATSYKIKGDLDSGATAGKVSPEGWLRFLMKFEVFPCNTLVATQDAFVALLLAQFPNMSVTEIIGLMSNTNLASVRLSVPQMPQMNQTLIWHKDIDGVFTGQKIIGFNRENAIEQLTEVGSDIMEADKFILNQTQVLTISENSGYSKMFKEAAQILDLSA